MLNIISIALQIHSHTEMQFDKIKGKDWRMFKKEHNL